jgi:hypothetical protein
MEEAIRMARSESHLAEIVQVARGELMVVPGAASSGPNSRAEAQALLFDVLGDLPEEVRHRLFGEPAQRVMFLYYEEGPATVGVVLEPATAVHGSSLAAVERHVRDYVAADRGVVHEDVRVFGTRVDRDTALEALQEILPHH